MAQTVSRRRGAGAFATDGPSTSCQASAGAHAEVSDNGGPPWTLTVLTVNLCILPAGVTNRFLLSRTVFVASILFAGGGGAMASWILGVSVLRFLLALPFAYIVSLFTIGLPLARLLGPALQLVGLNDYKCERIDLFLRELRERAAWQGVDIVCVQECYSCWFWPGGYPERLAEGARALGFEHVAMPRRRPNFPATLGLNSGLLILSRRPIDHVDARSFPVSVDATGVNRGVLYARLRDGTHMFNCHISPTATVCGDGLFAKAIASSVGRARQWQQRRLVEFVEEHAPGGERAVACGDFNLDVEFAAFAADPAPSAQAVSVVREMQGRVGLLEATGSIRGAQAHAPLRYCRPTFAYAGAAGEGGPPESHLTTFGAGGQRRHKCDDALFFRGCRGVDVAEESLVLPMEDRPHPSVTHLSDHWALRVVLTTDPPTTS